MAVTELHWILDGELAGSARPGLFNELADDMAELKALGIRIIVNLTEKSFDPPVSSFGFEGVHFPIDDMGIPETRQTVELCRKILSAIDREEPVLLHCKAGLGRTGTVLACCLILQGDTASEAVASLRRKCQYYIQTREQERFIHHFAQFLERGECPVRNLPRLRIPSAR